MFFLSLTWAALQTGTPGEVGVVLAAGSIPRLLILLMGGSFADRVSPKRIIIGTDAGRALVMAAAAVLLMLESMTTWVLVLVALAIGALDGFFLPAVGALPARIAPARLLPRVAAMRTVTQRVALLAGGPLAGWLIFVGGPSVAFWVSGALFALSVASLAIVSLRKPIAAEPLVESADCSTPAASGSPLRLTGLRDGLRAARKNAVLPSLLLLVAGMNLGFAGPVTAGLPLLAMDSHWGAPGAGILLGGFGLGATAAGLALVFVRWLPRAGMLSLAAVLTMGLSLAAVGVYPTFAAAVAATVVLGIASGVFGTVVHAMLLTSTAELELGRVMALLSLSVEGVVPISFSATGLLVGRIGAHSTFVVGGLFIVVAAALASTRPALRSFQLVRHTHASEATAADDGSYRR